MGSAWYVLYTKPKKENLVFSYLKSQGFEVFYPTVKVKPVNPRASKIHPLFPRYMFVCADLAEVGISALQWIPNVIGLVHFGGHPAVLPDNVVHEVRQQVAKLHEKGGMTPDGLKRGDPVRITQGPLAGYGALFDVRLSGTQRVQILLNMVGRPMKVQVDANTIEKL
jgi:transcription elongation factor/antiterminator RfaH